MPRGKLIPDRFLDPLRLREMSSQRHRLLTWFWISDCGKRFGFSQAGILAGGRASWLTDCLTRRPSETFFASLVNLKLPLFYDIILIIIVIIARFLLLFCNVSRRQMRRGLRLCSPSKKTVSFCLSPCLAQLIFHFSP